MQWRDAPSFRSRAPGITRELEAVMKSKLIALCVALASLSTCLITLP
jgi:hypothetical protein